ncbi:MAG: CoA pyrophosphatase [Halioglobus sp.]|jgi:8-oxo-dGTP pyrophosphatase MutT (NUDIX family)|nr:hydrolase, NUDIX family [marine gamma proteobacterium HTCC2148]MBT7720246.1 CoA pyrophosphatase [Halieaceae bacterium]MDG1386930.1 CoA pyrophosphatase [Halioglobus sp.]MDG2326074.1 CoA pyrophosphatase [Halioglobus sp.]
MGLLSPILQTLENSLVLNGLVWDHSDLPQAAVLVMLSDEAEPRVLLGRRAKHLKNHPGEIAFPGGKREPEDLTPWVTARREAWEEVGVREELVHALGELSPLVTRTGFEVHPCIARVPAQLELKIDYGEFDSLFTQPLSCFADVDLFRLERMQVNGAERMVPHYQMNDDNIWGVTAAVLAMMANIAYDAGLDLQRDWNARP